MSRDKAIKQILADRKEEAAVLRSGVEFIIPALRGSRAEEKAQGACNALQLAFEELLAAERLFTK